MTGCGVRARSRSGFFRGGTEPLDFPARRRSLLEAYPELRFPIPPLEAGRCVVERQKVMTAG
jgi:hypothetical protein